MCSVIGEEGEADLMKIKSDILTSNQDETLLNHYKDRLPSNIQDAKIEDLTVWVDPLDGTKEFTEGYLDHVTVLVGIAIGKKAIGGVIHQPFWNYQGGSQLQMVVSQMSELFCKSKLLHIFKKKYDKKMKLL